MNNNTPFIIYLKQLDNKYVIHLRVMTSISKYNTQYCSMVYCICPKNKKYNFKATAEWAIRRCDDDNNIRHSDVYILYSVFYCIFHVFHYYLF